MSKTSFSGAAPIAARRGGPKAGAEWPVGHRNGRNSVKDGEAVAATGRLPQDRRQGRAAIGRLLNSFPRLSVGSGTDMQKGRPLSGAG